MRWLVVFLGVIGMVAPVWADSGQLEINQSCAEGPGCFPGDPPGFPVRIVKPGSYRLTGSLLVTDPNVSAIQVDGQYVKLDLGGFEVRGPASCSGAGATLSCGPGGVGVGIDGAAGLDVRDGMVAGFGAGGVRLAGSGTVHGLRVLENGGHGIEVGEGGVVEDSRTQRNLGSGVFTGTGARVEDCHSNRNGSHGIEGGVRGMLRSNHALENAGFGIDAGALSTVTLNTLFGNDLGTLDRATGVAEPEGNRCGDDACSRDGRRLLYLSATEGNGSQALTLCDPGFHPAALFEIWDPSGLQYDTTRGQTRDDSGLGPPSGITGWVRTGSFQNTAGPNVGQANCDGWTSASGGLTGSSVRLEEFWSTTGPSWPWDGIAALCSATKGTWCVQD